MSSRLPVLSAPSRPSKPGPCFRTDADGRIALTRDWQKIFSAARRFESIALQTRHAFVRLIHIEKFPELTWNADGASANFSTGSLHLHLANGTSARGRLCECQCCGTPGRVEFHNAHGLDFLQLCALPDCAPSAWADYLLDVFARTPEPAATELIQTPVFPVAPLNCLTIDEGDPGELLPEFITALNDAEIPFSAILQTPELTHVREIHPHRVLLHGPILTVQALHTTLQIGLPAVRRLALGGSAIHGNELHLLGGDNTLLLTLAASLHPTDATRWHAALRAAFSTHS
ncbi:hypothetical protein [Oleiharenicola lentus]|uniref:hypothetical protein n=1 Tax=Oleiharenicola lentus TaxID=2508720 RepID=UPI003F67A46B